MKKNLYISVEEETDTLLRESAAEAGQTLSVYVERAIKAYASKDDKKPWNEIELRQEQEQLQQMLQRWENRGDRR